MIPENFEVFQWQGLQDYNNFVHHQYSILYSECLLMIELPITLFAGMVMIFTHVWMAIVARDDARAKGFDALLFLCCPPFALLYYMRIPKRKRRRIDSLVWIFLASTAVVIYRVS
jgi:hypothetical protein